MVSKININHDFDKKTNLVNLNLYLVRKTGFFSDIHIIRGGTHYLIA